MGSVEYVEYSFVPFIVTVETSLTTVDSTLQDWGIALMEPPSPILQSRVADQLAAEVAANFAAGGRPNTWIPNAASTLRRTGRTRRGGPLQGSGALEAAATDTTGSVEGSRWYIGEDGEGNPVVIAAVDPAFHGAGMHDNPEGGVNGRGVFVPGRPFMLIGTDAAENIGDVYRDEYDRRTEEALSGVRRFVHG